MRLRDVKAVLFDLDGTLVNSSEAIVNTIQKVLASKGISCDEAEVARMIGLPLENIFSVLAGNLSKGEIWQLVREYRKHYRADHLQNTEINPSSPVVLRKLKDKGLKLGIITGKPKILVMDELTYFAISDLFDVVVSGYEVKRHKPAPDIVLAAAKSLEIDPEQCVVVGDNPVDVIAGKKAGSFTIAVLSKVNDRKQLENAKPTIIIEMLEDILDVLQLQQT